MLKLYSSFVIFFHIFRKTKICDFFLRLIVWSGNLFVYKLLLNFLEKKSLDLDMSLSLALTQFAMRTDYRFCYKRLQTSTWYQLLVTNGYKLKVFWRILCWAGNWHRFYNLDLLFNQSNSYNFGQYFFYGLIVSL